MPVILPLVTIVSSDEASWSEFSLWLEVLNSLFRSNFGTPSVCLRPCCQHQWGAMHFCSDSNPRSSRKPRRWKRKKPWLNVESCQLSMTLTTDYPSCLLQTWCKKVGHAAMHFRSLQVCRAIAGISQGKYYARCLPAQCTPLERTCCPQPKWYVTRKAAGLDCLTISPKNLRSSASASQRGDRKCHTRHSSYIFQGYMPPDGHRKPLIFKDA